MKGNVILIIPLTVRPRPQRFCIIPLLEPNAEPQGRVTYIPGDVDTILAHPEQLAGAVVHFEEVRTLGGRPGDVALAPPSSQCWDHIL